MESTGRPLISILLPVFNEEAWLEVALESIRRQSFPYWECLILDDGSTDGSARIARRYAGLDSRFHLHALPHAGVVENANRGIALCRGSFVARMDGDDWMHPERLAVQLAAFEEEPELEVVGSHVELYPKKNLSKGMEEYQSWLNSIRTEQQLRRDAFIECPLANPSLLFRKESLQRFLYRDCGWPEDYDQMLRMLLSGVRIGICPQKLIRWRDHRGRLTRCDPRYSLKQFARCKAHHLCHDLLKNQRHYLLWGYGETGRLLQQALSQLGRRAAVIVDLHPGRMGQRIHGAEVIPPHKLDPSIDLPILASVARASARWEIRRFLKQRGAVEPVDFRIVA